MAMFLSVLLKVLMIIGIILLSLIGLLIFLVLILLLVPIRYKAEGYYKDGDYSLKAKASWLLRIVSVKYELETGETVIKILGIKLGKKTKKEKRPKKEKKPEKTDETIEETSLEITENNVESESSDFENTTESEEMNDDSTVNESDIEDESEEEIILIEDEDVSDEDVSDEDVSDEDNSSVKSKKKRKKKSGNKKYKKKQICDKINYYLEIIKSERFKKSVELCKKQLCKVLKAVLPKKWNVSAKITLEDPATIGKILAYYYMFFAVLYRHFDIECDCDEKSIDISGYFKGRIYLVVLLFVFIKVYFNKDIKKLIKMFKMEE